MKLNTAHLSCLFFAIIFLSVSCTESQKIKVLVFSKTEGFRHESIEAGRAAIQKMANEKDFEVSFTEDAEAFKESNLKNYNAVVFLNTTGDILNDEQQISFERYIQAGGGFVGIHSATDTEYEWPWYGGLVGAYFLDHPTQPSNVQQGKFMVTQTNHWATEGMPKEFEHLDEFYSFKNISPKINVVLEIDNDSYIGGNNPEYHPMSWYQEYHGGRSFYTAMGHTEETYTNPLFLNHLWAGIQFASGGDTPMPVDFAQSSPEENRFNKVVLAEKLDEPMELAILDKDRVLFIERNGNVKLYNTKSKALKTIASIPVSTKYVNKAGEESVAEDGLLGLNKDPNFAQNHWIYMYYSDPDKSQNVLSRFEMDGDELLLDSEKVMIEIPTQREQCCHTGGSIAWDSDDNLYLSTGDNTNPHGSDGYSPSDEREGRSAWDSQKSSANTNDLRGKIIRIHPEDDGTYTIPEGNLFAQGTENTRAEIYTMGHRNPFRISVDHKTGYLYWGEVGPDASQADSLRGPAGHDEVGQAQEAGNFGWPHFVGDNKAYYKYDFSKQQSLIPWDANAPVNTSPNNTGLEKLPPAQKAFIWYPYASSEEFPLVGTGGRNAMAGPVYYADDFKNAARAFPAYYDGKLMTYDWMRGWIMMVTMDEEGKYVSMERFMPSFTFSNPMDMAFADNGDLYMLEYGTGWFTQNDDARLIRIEYNGGNRKPKINIAANKLGGTAPLNLELNSTGTEDADGDELKYTWKISSENGFEEQLNTADANLTLSDNGLYQAMLTVDDGQGGISSQSIEITVGNEPPVVDFQIPGGNRSFYQANQSFQYHVDVKDKEDGSLGNGIDANQIAVSIDYLPEGFDQIAIAQGHRSADDRAMIAGGKKLIEASDCKGCHSEHKKSIGPSYEAIADKYKDDQEAQDRLSKKVIAGGGGVWGETVMAAHPDLSNDDASEMVSYILNVSKEQAIASSLPSQGSYDTSLPPEDKGKGVYILRAAYTDNGANGLPSLQSEQNLVLRNANMNVHSYDMMENVRKMSFNGNDMALPDKSGAYLALKDVDLNGLSGLQVVATAPTTQLVTSGGKIELRLDSPKGELIGTSEFLQPSASAGFNPSVLQVPVLLPEGFDNQLHDLYVVFVNPNDTGDQQTLMIVLGTEFQLENTALP